MSQPAGIRVRRTRDRLEIETILGTDRIYAAYAIGVLEDRSFGRSDWAIAERSGPVSGPGLAATQAILGIYRGFQPSLAFLIGPAPLIEDLLAHGIRPFQAYFACRPSHLDALQARYRTGNEDLMIRMRVSIATFRPGPHRAVELDARWLNAVNRLYARGVGAILNRALMEEGLYYGIFEGAELVAVAGTHFIAPTYGLAAVGNVFTHPAHRGRGLATAVTSAVTAALLRICPDIVLNVNAHNEPARRAYRRLGFEDYCPFVEVYGTRRDGSTLRGIFGRVFGAD